MVGEVAGSVIEPPVPAVTVSVYVLMAKLAVRVTLEEMKVTVVLAAVVEATVPVSPVQLTK